MTQPPDLLPFLDRTQKGSTVTEPKKEPKPRKTVFRLVVEYERDKFDMTAVQELVGRAGEHGTVKIAKLTGLPTSTDLA